MELGKRNKSWLALWLLMDVRSALETTQRPSKHGTSSEDMEQTFLSLLPLLTPPPAYFFRSGFTRSACLSPFQVPSTNKMETNKIRNCFANLQHYFCHLLQVYGPDKFAIMLRDLTVVYMRWTYQLAGLLLYICSSVTMKVGWLVIALVRFNPNGLGLIDLTDYHRDKIYE